MTAEAWSSPLGSKAVKRMAGVVKWRASWLCGGLSAAEDGGSDMGRAVLTCRD